MAEAVFSLDDIFRCIYDRGRIFSWWYLQLYLWQRPYFPLMISSVAFMTEAVFSLDDIFSCIYDRGRIFLHDGFSSVASISEAVFSLDDISSVKKTVTIEFRWIFVDGVEWMSYTVLYYWNDNDIRLSLHPINKYSLKFITVCSILFVSLYMSVCVSVWLAGKVVGVSPGVKWRRMGGVFGLFLPPVLLPPSSSLLPRRERQQSRNRIELKMKMNMNQQFLKNKSICILVVNLHIVY